MATQVGSGYIDITGRPDRSQIRKAAEATGRMFQSSFLKILTSTLKASFITALAAQAGVLVVKLLSIIPALTSILSLASAIPGFIGGMIVSVGILKAAFVGVGDAISAAFSDDINKFNEALKKLSGNAKAFAIALREQVPLLREVRRGIQDAFFGFGLVQEIGKLGTILKKIGPELNFLAAGFGELAAKFLEFSSRVESMNALVDIIHVFGRGVRNISVNFESLAMGFRDLSTAALPLLDKFIMGIGNVAGKFGLWMSQISASGQLQGWIATALETLRVLGQILGDVFVIFMRIGQAAQVASGGTLQAFAELTGQLVDFLSSTEGMNILVDVFKALQAVASALLPPFLSLAATVLGVLGPAITELAAVLGPVLLAAVHMLEPAIGPLVQALLAILTAIAPILPVVGQLVGLLGGVLAQVLTALAPTISLIVNLFSRLAGPVIGLLSTVLGALVGALQPVLDALLSGLAPILPIIVDLITSLAVAIAPLAVMIGEFLATAVQQLLPPLALLIQQVVMALLPGIESLVPALIQILQAFLPIIPVLAQLIIGLTPLIVLIARLASVITTELMTILTPLITILVKFIGIGLEQLIPVLTGIIAIVVKLANVLIDDGVRSFNEGIQVLQRIWNSVKQFGTGLQWAITQVVIFVLRAKGAFDDLRNKVLGVFSNAGSWLMDAGRRIIDGLISGIQGAIGRLKSMLNGVTRLIPDWKGPLSTDLKLLQPSGEALMAGLMDGIDSKARDLFQQLRDITSGVGSIGGTPALVGASIGGGGGGGGVNRSTIMNVGGVQINVAANDNRDPRIIGEQVADGLIQRLTSAVTHNLDPRAVAGLVDEGRRQRSATFPQRSKK